MPELIASLGLKSQKLFPVLVLSKLETAEAGRRIHGMIGGGSGPVVGIFVGGRKTRGKRWASANFIELAVLPRSQGARPIVFVGPEERDTLPYLRAVLAHRVPVVFEPDVRARAAMVANCDLFVACDSGPLHLACALGVRTVAIFLKSNFDRWEPPAELGRIVYRETGVRVMDILTACRIEVDRRFGEREAGRIVNG